MPRPTARRWTLGLVPLLALVACNDPFQVIETVDFAESLGIDLAQMELLPEGIYRQDLTVGTGAELVPGSTATADYTGWLADGTQFGQGTAFAFTLGDGRRVDGWDPGVEGMLVGGVRRVIIPPELAYGDAPPLGSSIPEGAILVFEITLTDVQ